MNPHLKQLWAAMRLPENFKKSYKFFCRGLDIRVPQVMKAEVGELAEIQNPFEVSRELIGVQVTQCPFFTAYMFKKNSGICIVR